MEIISIILATDGNNYINYGASAGLVINTWYHLVCVYNGSSMSVYINGVAKTVSNTTLGTYTGMIDTSSVIAIGSWTLTPNSVYTFAGKIDDVRIYNRALSTDEIAKLYNE